MQQIIGKGCIYRIDVIGNSADNIAGLVAVKKAHRQLDQFIEKVFPHLINDFLAQFNHQHGENIGKPGGYDVKHQHQPTVPEYHWEIGFSRADANIVDGQTGQKRPKQCQKVADKRQQQRRCNHPFVLKQIAPQPDQDFLAVFGLLCRG